MHIEMPPRHCVYIAIRFGLTRNYFLVIIALTYRVLTIMIYPELGLVSKYDLHLDYMRCLFAMLSRQCIHGFMSSILMAGQ